MRHGHILPVTTIFLFTTTACSFQIIYEFLPPDLQGALFFGIVSLLFILTGSPAIVRGKVKLFGKEYQGLSARVVGVVLVVVGLFVAAMAVWSLVAS
jgi:hypothetical protein